MKIIKSSIFNPLSLSRFEYFDEGAILIDENGIIADYGKFENIAQKYSEHKILDKSDCYLMPGMIDTHTHLPQFEAKSCGHGELLEWLEKYIFPLEIKFADDKFAQRKSAQFYKELIKHGTTTAVIYTANFRNATDIAFYEAEKAGIRAFIGNSVMNTGGTGVLFKSTEENIDIINEMKDKWHGRHDRLFFIVSPRFAGCVSSELMRICADIANRNDLMIQTHLSENLSEIEYIKTLYPERISYSDIYLHHKLLSSRTLLAHCIHLAEDELQILKDNNCTVVHCPSSNRFLGSGIMPFANYIDMGLKVSLGTDVAAGYSMSLINEAKEAREMSKLFSHFNTDQNPRAVSISEVFYSATLGGAVSLHISDIAGNISKNKHADLVLINKNKLPAKEMFMSAQDILSEILYSVKEVDETYIKGEQKYSSSFVE